MAKPNEKPTHLFTAKLRDGSVHRTIKGETFGTRTFKDAFIVAIDIINAAVDETTHDRVELILHKPKTFVRPWPPGKKAPTRS